MLANKEPKNRMKSLHRVQSLVLGIGVLGVVACQSNGAYRPGPRLSLDGSQLTTLERTGLPHPNNAQASSSGLRESIASELRENAANSGATLNGLALAQPQGHVKPKGSATTLTAGKLTAKEQTLANKSTLNPNSKQSENHEGLQSADLQASNENEHLNDAEPDDEGTALVDEAEIDEDKEILDADSAKSPEEVAELLQSLDVKGQFALCEGSVYLDEWRRIFDSQFIAQNKHRFKKTSALRKALEEARSKEYTKLLLPTLANLDFDYPVIINEDVIKWIQYFQTRGRKAFVTWLRRAEDIIPQSVPVLEKFGLPKDLIYLAMIESGFNNKATSSARAAGTWQFMRATGKNFGLKLNDYVDERRDPEKATVAAAKYLTYLYTLFGDWHLAAASYNAGEGRVAKGLRGQSDKSFFAISAARRLPNETRNYVPKLMAAMIISKNPTRFGFEVAEGSRALRTRGLALEKSVRLADLAHAIGVDLKVLETINPELRLGVTPPGQQEAPYFVRVPESAYANAIAAVDTLPQASRSVQIVARVKRKESVGKFASRYGISLATLLKANPTIRPNVRLAKGQSLMIPVALGTGQYERLTYEDKASRRKSRSTAARLRSDKLASRKSSKVR